MSLPYSYAECSLFIYAVVMDEAQGNREGVSPCKIDFWDLQQEPHQHTLFTLAAHVTNTVIVMAQHSTAQFIVA